MSSVELLETAGQQRFLLAREALIATLDRLTRFIVRGSETAIPGLWLHRLPHPGEKRHALQKPAFALIAQGSKRLQIGDQTYHYDSLNYLVSAVDLPVSGQVVEASFSQPYLGMRLDFTPNEISELLHDSAMPPLPKESHQRGLYISPLDPHIVELALRLLNLLDNPTDIPILLPQLKREILYRLLMSPQGGPLRALALEDSHTQRIARAIHLLRNNLTQPLRVESLAKEAFMSVSTFHYHFKQVTTLSPLRYQKQLRLQEARRLVFASDADVAQVANAVGYKSVSQFSREYSALFGQPPLRDRRRAQPISRP
ncbi:AraC family transcriptional regulator [Paramixta manurensis]|uniref:AraC family transcriptional regulator n=1 Tax=Paramixta manurensis TaxID=2740817 RepID=A0A6M8UM21_9GAMM|nr:AraC family transcriptional regulator [Erwiniaceae bacterium PD-1]